MTTQRIAIVCLLCAVIGAVGAHVLLLPVVPRNARFDLWVGMMMAQCAVWGMLVPLIAVSLWRRAGTWRRWWPTYTVGLVTIGIFFWRGMTYEVKPSRLVVGLEPVMDIVNAVSALIAIGLALALWNEASQFDTAETERAYANVRDDVSAFQTLLGVLLGLAVVVKGTMHYALEDVDRNDMLHPENLLLYGVFHSIALALTFIPAYAAAIRKARSLYNAKTGTLAEAKELRTWLRLDSLDPLGAVSSAAAILAPLIAGVLSVAVPKLTSS